MITEVETEVTWPQAKECQKLKKAGMGFSSRVSTDASSNAFNSVQ